jgi:hypothetical protein
MIPRLHAASASGLDLWDGHFSSRQTPPISPQSHLQTGWRAELHWQPQAEGLLRFGRVTAAVTVTGYYVVPCRSGQVRSGQVYYSAEV